MLLAFACAAPAGAPAGDWHTRSSYHEIFERALVLQATTLGGEYDQKLLSARHIVNAERNDLGECRKRHPGEPEDDFVIAGYILGSGRLVNVRASLRSAVSDCLASRVGKLVLPHPPSQYLPFAVAIKFDGKTSNPVSPFAPFRPLLPPPPPAR